MDGLLMPAHSAPLPIRAVRLTTLKTYAFAVAATMAVCGLATQCLAIATGHDSIYGIVTLFDPLAGRAAPVWLASAMLLASAVFAAAIGESIGQTSSSRAPARPWWLLAAVLAALSAERMASIRLNRAMLDVFGAPSLVALVSAAGAVVAVLVYLSCLSTLPRSDRWRFAVPAGLFALGFATCRWLGASPETLSVGHQVARVVGLLSGRAIELIACSLFILASLARLRAEAREVWIPLPQLRQALLIGTTIALACSFAVSSAYAIGWRVEGVYQALNVDHESNLPTWYSSMLLLACAAALACIAATSRSRGDRPSREWTWLAVLFAAMSADEALALHEMSVLPLRAMLGENPWLRYPLILPGTLVVASIAAVFAGFLRRQEADTRRALFVGATLVVIGALVVELISGWFDPSLHGPNITYVALATLEEGCEMAGAVVILLGLLRHLERSAGQSVDLCSA